MAERLLASLLQQQPTLSNVIALAAHRQTLGDIDGAVGELQSWIKGHPDDHRAREKLAELYARSNRTDTAILEYREILEGAPDYVNALNNLAWYLLDDDPEDALKYAKRAVGLNPDSSLIIDTLAMAQLKNNKVWEARRSIDRARGLAPTSPVLLFHEAKIMLAEGDQLGAMSTLHALLDHNSENFSEEVEAEVFLELLE